MYKGVQKVKIKIKITVKLATEVINETVLPYLLQRSHILQEQNRHSRGRPQGWYHKGVLPEVASGWEDNGLDEGGVQDWGQ